MSLLYGAASVNSSNATGLRANSVPIYHVIQVRMPALVVDRVGHAPRISTVAIVTVATAINTWRVALIKHGVTRRVHSFGVSPSFPVETL